MSEESIEEWLHEFQRKSEKGGIILFTTQGEAFLEKLTEKEKNSYLNKKLIQRTKVMEGNKVYACFHHKDYILRVLDKSDFQMHKFIFGS